jgi:radial spoke head protein 9
VNDFLDNAADCECKEEWTVGRDITQSTAILRNRHWPGFFAFHRNNTPVFGAFYLGNGIKNVDLEFML